MNVLQTLTVRRSGETPSPEVRILLDEPFACLVLYNPPLQENTPTLTQEDENHRRMTGELEDMGMSGLACTFSFIQPSGDRGNILMWVTQLVDKMIERWGKKGTWIGRVQNYGADASVTTSVFYWDHWEK